MSEINLVAVVCGGLFGGLFILTCILSAIKAIKDRKKIKMKIAERERKKSSTYTYDNTNLDTREEAPREFCSIEEGHNYSRCGEMTGETDSARDTNTNSNAKRYVHFSNYSDKVISSTNSTELKVTSRDNDPSFQGKLLPQCLAEKKQIRRNSYELAMDRKTLNNEKCTTNLGMQSAAFENEAFNIDSPGD